MKQKDFVIIFGSVATVVLLWIGFTLYDTSVTSSLDPNLITDVQPIVGNFDQETLSNVVNRQAVEAQFSTGTPSSSISAIIPSPLLTLPTPTPTGVKSATNSALIIP